MLQTLTTQLRDRVALSPEQVREAVGCLVHEGVRAEDKADFLFALAEKGETPQEIAAFAV
jgi:anthranilate phosphoribosyltransferase